MPSKSKKQARMNKADKGTGILKGPVHQRAKEMKQAKRDISMLKRKRMT